MAIYVSKNGDIHFYKGDSGNIVFKGLPTDKNYSVYFAVSNPETSQVIGNELSVNSNNSSSVTFNLTATYTNQFSILLNEPFAEYQYGLKICYGTDEYTLIPKVILKNGEPVFSGTPKVVVHQKMVEGA